MSEVHLSLLGWQHKRATISELAVYAEVRLNLPPGRYKLYTLFVCMPYRWYAGADGPITLPDPALVVLDLDQATVDEVLVPPP